MEKNIIPRKQHQVIYEKVGRKSFSCYNCNHTAHSKRHIISHLKEHDDKKIVLDHIERTNSNANASSKMHKLSKCIHCNAAFNNRRALDDHVVKRHPTFITSITSQLYKCSECNYKTTKKDKFDKHKSACSKTVGSYQLVPCIHCNATFKSKSSLDDHVVKKHPNFISSITSKLYECTKCYFKSAVKGSLDRHMLKHNEAVSSYKLSTCVYCNSKFKSKTSLDEHILKKHPDFIASVTSKLHECTQCIFKTVVKSSLDKHLLEHPETDSDFKLSTCIHCNATFKSKSSLDDHVVRKHPDFMKSVAKKIYECTKCSYRTTLRNSIERHMSAHPETISVDKISRCSHCKASFKSKASLDGHVVKKHPDFITSVTTKIYECTICIYKTTFKHNFDRHMALHIETASSYKSGSKRVAKLKSKASLE